MMNRLSSIRLFFFSAILLLLACALGGIIPQGEPPEKYHEMFGHVLGPWIVSLGMAQVFQSFWFSSLLALSALNLAACSVKRWKAVRARPGVFLSHLAVLMIFAGGIVRGLFSQRGYLPLEKGRSSEVFYLQDGRQAPLPFSVTLKDFRLHYWTKEEHKLHAFRTSDGLHEWARAKVGGKVLFNPIGIEVRTLRFYPNFTLGASGPSSLNEARENPALEVLVREEGEKGRRFLFARFPDFAYGGKSSPVKLVYEYVPGKVRQFESLLGISVEGREVLEKRISVNSPLEHQGWRFFQSGYDPKNPDFSGIQVSKDPSVPLVYGGFSLLLIGLGWAFLTHKGR